MTFETELEKAESWAQYNEHTQHLADEAGYGAIHARTTQRARENVDRLKAGLEPLCANLGCSQPKAHPGHCDDVVALLEAR